MGGKRLEPMPMPPSRTARPIFPALMSFPVACFIGALVTDIVYARTAEMTWETFSVWLLTVGLIVAGVAVVIGLVDGLARGRWPARAQSIGYALALVLSIVNAFVHSRDGYTSVVPQGLALSAVVVVVLLVTLASGRAVARRVVL